MANNLRTKLHFFIRLVGFLVFFFGIFILASAIKIRNLLTGELAWYYGYGNNTCQYWAGIPVCCRWPLINSCLVLFTKIERMFNDIHYSSKANRQCSL